MPINRPSSLNPPFLVQLADISSLVPTHHPSRKTSQTLSIIYRSPHLTSVKPRDKERLWSMRHNIRKTATQTIINTTTMPARCAHGHSTAMYQVAILTPVYQSADTPAGPTISACVAAAVNWRRRRKYAQ